MQSDPSFPSKKLMRKSFIASLVILLLIVMEGTARRPLVHAQSARQTTIPGNIGWYVETGKSKLSICYPTRNSPTIEVYIVRQTYFAQPVGPDKKHYQFDWIGGGKVSGTSADETIAEIVQGQGVERQVSGIPTPHASFKIKAKKVGNTQITFRASLTGDEARYPGKKLVAQEKTINVEVTPCFEAVTGALGTVWPKSDVCSLARPFLLEGKNPDLGFGTSTGTNALFFWPSSVDMLTGRYIYVNKTIVPNMTCVDVSSGKYDVLIRPASMRLSPDDPYIDLYLKGSSDYFCPDPFHTQEIGFLIALKALKPTDSCQESLP